MPTPRLTACIVTSCLVTALSGCASSPRASEEGVGASGIAGLAWLAGSWSGPHDGGMFEEHWTMPEGGLMVGMSKLTVEGKAVFFEYARIVQNPDGTVDYVAQPAGKPPTKFRMTSSTASAAVFENPGHDDPQLIRYARSGDRLEAATESPRPDGSRVVHAFSLTRTSLASGR